MNTFGSLFAGIGGLDLGLERAGWQCKWQVEIDEYATRVLEKHWPGVDRWRDVRTFPPNAAGDGRDGVCQGKGGSTDSQRWLPELEGGGARHPWHVDLVAGGFPCQDISYAGAGAGLEGDRSGLFFEALRVVRQLQPRYVLLENVAALLSRGLDRVCGELAAIGYDCQWYCIPAAAVGAPHIRDRVFVVGYSDRTRLEKRHRCQTQRTFTTPELCDWWAAEPDVGRVANGVPARVDRIRGLGNAVVPQVAEYVGKMIMEMDNG